MRTGAANRTARVAAVRNSGSLRAPRPPRRRTKTTASFPKTDDRQRLEHPDGAGAALVVRRDDSKRTLVVEERFAVDRVRDNDVVCRETRVELRDREDDLVTIFRASE